MPDGEVFFVSGIYHEVRPPAKLVHTWHWENEPGFPETLLTVEFPDRKGSTELLLTTSSAKTTVREGGFASTA